MKKPTALIWAAWLIQAVAWFLPLIGEGTSLPQGLVVRQFVVHHIKRISFSLAEVLRFGIAC
jgi:hypothetical protein